MAQLEQIQDMIVYLSRRADALAEEIEVLTARVAVTGDPLLTTQRDSLAADKREINRRIDALSELGVTMIMPTDAQLDQLKKASAELAELTAKQAKAALFITVIDALIVSITPPKK